MATQQRAREAKNQVKEFLRGVAEVNGVGITRVDEGWAVRVNLLSALPARKVLPSAIDGVPVEARIVGPATAHAG